MINQEINIIKETTNRIKCNLCSKTYKTKESYYNHKRRYHMEDIIEPISSVSKTCEYCNKIFSRTDNKTRHEATCKSKNNLKIKVNILEKKVKELLKTIEIIKNENDLLKLKQNDKELKSINDINKKLDRYARQISESSNCNKLGNINKGNIINNINNGTINNNITNIYNIVELGNENLLVNLSKKEQLKILQSKFTSIDYLIECVHCSDKYKQFQNIIITNCKDNIGYKYDSKSKKFIATNKDNLLNELVNARVSDIKDFHEIHYEKLDTKTKATLDKFLTKIQNDKKFKKQKKNEINFLMYNNSNKIISKFEVQI